MYPQELPFPRERPRKNPPPPLQLNQPFPLQPVNYYPSQSSSRSQLNDKSFVSPTGLTSADRSILSIKSPSHDYGQEPIRVFRQPPGISNFAPHHVSPNMAGSSKPVKVFHSRAITQLIGRTGYPNGLALSHGPGNFIPPNTNYGTSFTPMSSHERVHTYERPPEHREDKVLMFLERQNAVIEKLAMRIQQEERDSMQRDKRELEQKLLDLQQAKMLQQQEESARILPKLISEPSLPPKEKEEPERPKEKSNTLETIGKFYLMAKLMEGKKHKRSVSDPNAQRLLQNAARERPRESSLLRDGDDDDRTPTIRSSGLLRVQSQKPGSMLQNVLMNPMMLDDGESDEYQSRRISLNRKKGVSARDLRELRGNKGGYERGARTNDNSYDEEEDLMEDERPETKTRRKPLIRKSRTIKTPKNNAQDDAKAKKKAKAEADALAAAEEEKKKQEKRKKEIRIKLKCFLWCINYPHCLFDDVRKKVESRKEEIQKKMSGNIQMNFEAAQSFLLAVGEKFIKEMVLESKQLDLYNPKKSISEGDLNTRSTLIFNYLKGLFDKMIVGTNATNISKNLFRFLCSISEDSGVLPHNFMFDFEVKRLQFTYYATLKYQTQLKSKMVIGLFILLRVLLHKMIMRPWTVIPGLKKDKVKMNNLLTIGSILYHTVLDFFRGNVPIYPNNQNFLPMELKVKARSVPLEAMEVSPDADEQDLLTKKEEPKAKEIEPITGFLTKDQLKCFFVERKKLYDQLKALVDGWLEKIYQLTHTIYLNTPKEERETMGIPE